MYLYNTRKVFYISTHHSGNTQDVEAVPLSSWKISYVFGGEEVIWISPGSTGAGLEEV